MNCHATLEKYNGKTVIAISASVHFQNKINFKNNSGTAIELFFSKLIIDSNTTVMFSENKGYRGGAVRLIDHSFIVLNDNTFTVFSSNSALYTGGAIYQEYPKDKCFIEYAGHCDVNHRNITVEFSNNTITNNSCLGSDVFLPSTKHCLKTRNKNIIEVLNTIAKFCLNESGISTDTLQLSFIKHTYKFYPGISTKLDVCLIDELNNQVSLTGFRVEVKSESNDSLIYVDEAYKIVTNK